MTLTIGISFSFRARSAQAGQPADSEDLRQGFGVATRRVIEVQGYAGTAVALEEAANGDVAACPVADHDTDAACAKGGGDLGLVERGALIDLAGEAPVGGEIEEDGRPFGAKHGEPGLAERLGGEVVRRVPRRHRLDGAHERQRCDDRQHDEHEREPDPPFALPPAEPPQANPSRSVAPSPSAMPSTPLWRP